MPAASTDGPAYSAAGVRKPPMKETALRERRACRKRYGDLSAAGEVCDWDRADPASVPTVKRLKNEASLASDIINCRTI
jgi:hypothetical protein